MADTKNIIKLDQRLIKDKLIDANLLADYKKVHSFLNSHVRKNGKILTEETFSKGDAELRSWLMILYKKGASQDKLTSYLRVGLAHLCFNFIESTYSQIPLDDLIGRTLTSFKKRNFQKTFFKVSMAEAKDSVRGKQDLKDKKKAAKKKAVKKKIVKKKIVKKKVTKKKPTKKASAKKKTRKPAEKKGFFARIFS